MSLSHLYTPLSEALQELQQRRSNPQLIERIESFFSALPSPKAISGGPRAVVSRALFTPTHEIRHFIRTIVPSLPIQPLFFEGDTDKFVGLNPEKRCLGKMSFTTTNDPTAFEILERRRIVDFRVYEGRQIRHVKTLSGQKLTSFHHILYQDTFGPQTIPIVDYSDWFFAAERFSTDFPYLRYLALFLVEGILFENYLESDVQQKSFTERRAIPAINELERLFGIRPLIVPLTPREHENSEFWNYYPSEVRTLFKPMTNPPARTSWERIRSMFSVTR